MIELKVDEFFDGKVNFHIERQDEEDYNRIRNHNIFFEVDKNIYHLYSGAFPFFYQDEKEFFVRGTEKKFDDTKLTVTISEYLNIFELVKKYNEKFS